MPLLPHGVVIECATRATVAIDGALQAAQKSGALQPINRAFRQQRIQAGAQGRRAPSYSATIARLRDVLFAAAVQGQPRPPMQDVILRALPTATDRARPDSGRKSKPYRGSFGALSGLTWP